LSNTDYQKQAQDYYGKAPLIILGSGASAAHGLSGMAALASYLINHTDVVGLSPIDQAGWQEFSKILRDGINLETALHQVAISEELTGRIIKATWSLINTEDLQFFADCIGGAAKLPLGKLLIHMFESSLSTVNMITTNYDRLGEYACEQAGIHHYSGFTHGFFRQLAAPNDLAVNRKVNIWKVHGSLDWFKSPTQEIVAFSNINGVPPQYEPQIVTPGSQKYHRTHMEPYRSIINHADQAITAANSYLCVGYGFNDEHIQPKLMVKCMRQNIPITIVTYALSEAARKHIINGGVQNYLAIERGNSDDQSLVYSSLNVAPIIVEKNLWCLEGYLSLIM
jgi:hypothetical protein